MSARRIFWGRSLAQAVAKAARHYQRAPELLAWRVYEKRHGFVRHVRPALIEVDPEAPPRTAPEPPAASAAPPTAPVQPTQMNSAPTAPARSSGLAQPSTPAASPARAQNVVAQRNDRPFDAPDETVERAALEAIGRLLRFAGIEASAVIVGSADRIEVALAAEPGAEATVEIDLELLEELEHLLPKAILTLSGRRVRATIDFGGQREARAEELRRAATELATKVRAGEEKATLGPLSPAERRIVHLLFESDPEIATESLGDGHLKQLRLVKRP